MQQLNLDDFADHFDRREIKPVSLVQTYFCSTIIGSKNCAVIRFAYHEKAIIDDKPIENKFPLIQA